MTNQKRWENAIKIVLGDDSPCIDCLVQVSCKKSFSGGSACDKLRQALQHALETMNDENKS